MQEGIYSWAAQGDSDFHAETYLNRKSAMKRGLSTVINWPTTAKNENSKPLFQILTSLLCAEGGVLLSCFAHLFELQSSIFLILHSG